MRLIILLTAGLLAVSAVGETNVWTNAANKAFVGNLKSIDRKTAVFTNSNGVVTEIPLSALSKDTIRRARRQLGAVDVPPVMSATVRQAKLELKRIAASRRKNPTLPPHSRQRVVVDNLTDCFFDGNCEYEPWLGIQGTFSNHPMYDIRLLDEEGRVMPMQLIPADCLAAIQPHRMLFPIQVPSGERRVLSLDYANRERFQREAPLPVPTAKECCSPRIVVYKDTTDTWSHGASSYPTDGGVELSVMEQKPVELFDGPLATEWRHVVADKAGSIRFEVITRKYHNEKGIHLRFTNLTLIPPRSIVKLSLTPPFKATARQDHVAGGLQPRAMDGREYPFQDVILVEAPSRKKQFTVITRDCTACDVQPDGTIRLTLMRTPFFCHHDPNPEPAHQARHPMDQQLTSWNVYLTTECAPHILANERFNLTEPLTVSETTLGMLRDEANI